MSESAATLMRRNLEICHRQMLDLARKATAPAEIAAFNRGAETYARLVQNLPGHLPQGECGVIEN